MPYTYNITVNLSKNLEKPTQQMLIKIVGEKLSKDKSVRIFSINFIHDGDVKHADVIVSSFDEERNILEKKFCEIKKLIKESLKKV